MKAQEPDDRPTELDPHERDRQRHASGTPPAGISMPRVQLATMELDPAMILDFRTQLPPSPPRRDFFRVERRPGPEVFPVPPVPPRAVVRWAFALGVALGGLVGILVGASV